MAPDCTSRWSRSTGVNRCCLSVAAKHHGFCHQRIEGTCRQLLLNISSDRVTRWRSRICGCAPTFKAYGSSAFVVPEAYMANTVRTVLKIFAETSQVVGTNPDISGFRIQTAAGRNFCSTNPVEAERRRKSGGGEHKRSFNVSVRILSSSRSEGLRVHE